MTDGDLFEGKIKQGSVLRIDKIITLHTIDNFIKKWEMKIMTIQSLAINPIGVLLVLATSLGLLHKSFADEAAVVSAEKRTLGSEMVQSPPVETSARTVAQPPEPPRLEGINLALHKPVKQSSTIVAPTVKESSVKAANAVDGNTDGDLSKGSVTHTGQDANAWLDVDLGKAKTINGVIVWNRTDCCKERLANYWVFVSSKPFSAKDTVETLKGKAGVWGKQGALPEPSATIEVGGIKGRYVRIQLSDSPNNTNAYLSLAEVQIIGK